MKKLPLALIVFGSCFAGVFAALRFNGALQSPAPEIATPIYSARLTGASYEEGAQSAPDFRGAAKRVTPSVVTVDQFRQGANMWGDPTGQLVQSGTGSGVVLSADGIVVTNNHVVAGAQQVKVRTSDHKTYEAKVLGRDSRSDIAVLKIEGTGFTPIEVGNSEKLEVGEWVMAVGNPLGFDNTVSVGVVSSLGRSLGVERSVMTDAIQTDAAINPGNSGGALTNAAGQLIGINAVIASPTRASVGIGFAIPINRVKKIVNDIRTVGHARYAGLGVSYDIEAVGLLQLARFRRQFEQQVGSEPPTYGIIIGAVEGGSAAHSLGLKPMDVLLAIDNRSLQDPLVLSEVLNKKSPGDTVSVKYWSRGTTKTANVKLGEVRPPEPLE